MAPPELGSQSEDSQTDYSQLEHIEHTLRKLQQSTLKIKKKNDVIINSIDRQSRSCLQGWKGAAIDVPGVPLQKPPRKSKSMALLDQDVENVLRESSEMKRKMQETLKACAESRQENQKYLEELRTESLKLSSIPCSFGKEVLPRSTSMAFDTKISTGSLLNGLKNAFRKLGSNSAENLSTSRNTNKIIISSPLKNNSNQPIKLLPMSLEDVPDTSTLPPAVKPRTKLSTINKENIPDREAQPQTRKRPLDPPPLPPLTTLQDFKNLCQSVASEDEMTLPKPIPKPRRDRIQRQESSLSNASSDFEYVETPLVVQTVPGLDSDESLQLVEEDKSSISKSSYQKRQQKQTPRPHWKLSKVRETSPEVTKNFSHTVPKPKIKVRPASPPPSSLLHSRLFEGSLNLSQLLEESDSNSITENTDKLEENKFYNCGENCKEIKISALCDGIQIKSIQVPVIPWVHKEPQTHNIIKDSPFHLPTAILIPKVQIETEAREVGEIDPEIEETLEVFAFLEETEETTNEKLKEELEMDKSCLHFQLHDLIVDLPDIVKFHAESLYPTFERLNEQPILNSIQEKDFLEDSSPTDDAVNASAPPPLPPPIPTSICKPHNRFSSLPLVPLDDSSLESSIFSTLRPIDEKTLQFDMSFIVENFAQKDSPLTEKRRLSLTNFCIEKKDKILSPFSLMYQQTIEIGSRKITKSKEEISEAIKTLNSTALNSDEVQLLQQMIPKEHEASGFKSLDEECKNLKEGYKIMNHLIKIPRLQSKLDAITSLLNFDYSLNCIIDQIRILQEATESIKASEKFRNILGLVLTVINKAFAGNQSQEVKGFQIQSLERLARKKASNNSKMNLLNCIVKCIQETMPEDIDFYKDFKSLEEASKISVKDIQRVFHETGTELEQVKIEISRTADDYINDEEMLLKLKSSEGLAEDAFQKHKSSFNIWKSTLQELKQVVKLFGFSNTADNELVEFFSIIKRFVDDYIKAYEENDRIFLVPQQETVKTENIVKMRKTKRLSDCSTSKDSSNLPVNNRRKSIGPATFTQQQLQALNDNSGQPTELFNVLLNTVTGVGMLDSELRQRKARNGRKSDNVNL